MAGKKGKCGTFIGTSGAAGPGSGAHLCSFRGYSGDIVHNLNSLRAQVERMESLMAARASATSFSPAVQSPAIQRPARPSAFVIPVDKNGKLKRAHLDSWQHDLVTKSQPLHVQTKQHMTAFSTQAAEKSVSRAKGPRAACPCCGRRAALLGGAAGLLLPNQGLAQEAAAAAATQPPGALRQWYEEFFAFGLAKGGAIYEPKVRPYKDAVFHQLQDNLAESKAADSTLEVLEIGVGPAPNLHYWADWPGRVHVTGVDRNSSMEPYAQENAHQPGLDRLAFDFSLGSAADLPVPSTSVDVVVGTLILCSVDDVARSLLEVRRVLRPGGKYLFIEHVAAPDGTALRQLQNTLNPLQQALADGCHLNRDTLQAVRRTGFASVDASSINIDGLSLLAPHIVGIATA
ncbi:S-adenosyl-L-methionine dependent methyltransferases [Klebsormidium nitens]|uniref:S-adenosyl-L-methionine dependent methyltransferases n=1 Tax=Klebsormidium nitens TaxID=105231 RepID=A0A1Y1HY52_KLENI|nr:S-adenosyl-L-methionine dependent methyltransferases [Klebsormidium nitens]|eukprot:GAQ81467.1 S-adenosyl-L-methionine dependent methyltransferases [Klebsormidium nitens]